jgi:hypothetical protein
MAKRRNRKTKDYSKAELKRIYARAREEFTAEDLQKYTIIEKGIPAEKVLTQLESIHRRYSKTKN